MSAKPTRKPWATLDSYIENENGCWIWQGHITAFGYGSFRGTSAHRVMYEAKVGPIPTGLQLDHLCYVRACVNPAHLEPVTRAENNRRANARHVPRTHCKWGHEYTPENTYVWRHERKCRQCRADRERTPSTRNPTTATHCPNGHEFTPENTYRGPRNQSRVCRTCATAAKRRHAHRLADAQRAEQRDADTDGQAAA